MPVTYKDPEQEREVDIIVDDLLENCRDELINNNIIAVYQRIMNSEVGQKMQGDRLGKITEVLLELYPEMLHHINELPMGMFYGCGLTELDIPANVTKLGQGVFALSDIRKINYEGTRDQWNTLTRNSDRGWDILLPSGQKVQDLIEVNCSDAQNIYGVNIAESSSCEVNEETPCVKEEILQDSMTKKEVIFKHNVLNYLREDGFNTFADYLSKFHFNFLTSKEAGKPFVAAIAPTKGIILINPNIQVEGLSMVLRHEAAHQIFKHMEHMFAKLKKLGIKNPSQFAHKLSNYAGDYHISNYIYDDDDKYIAKHLKIENMEDFKGLVTELDFPENPEYWTMEFDDLWDVLVNKWHVTKEQLEDKVFEQNPEAENPQLSPEYIEGWNAVVDAFKKGEISKDQLRQWYNKKLVG